MNIKCRLFGHTLSDYTDSGFEHCARCKHHSYYDGVDNSGVLIKPWWYIRNRWYDIRNNIMYWFNKKRYGDDWLPF